MKGAVCMSPNLERLKADSNSLTMQERAELAFYLIETLEPESDADVDDAWEVEVDRRIQQIRLGEVGGVPADQVFAELRARRK